MKTHKHLGLTLSSNLSWSSHIDSILNSVTPMADILKKLKYQVDKESLEKIYCSFIRPNWSMVITFGTTALKVTKIILKTSS